MGGASRISWPVTALSVFVLVALAHLGGYLDRLEFGAADVRAGILQHEVDSGIVLVGIDARSLAELQQWPWPRRHHAQLIERLEQANPKGVFFDIDFSTPSSPDDDALLETALRSWQGAPIVLPVLFQQSTGADSDLILTRPLPQFASHVALAAVNLVPSADGMVRSVPLAWNLEGQVYPTIAGIDSGVAVPEDVEASIDFSIAPSSFEYLSYGDLLNEEIPLPDLSGKTVYVGAFAIELGDMVPVPVHQRLPGVVVQALAAQTLASGALRTPPGWVYLALLAAWTALCAASFTRLSWRGNLLLLAGGLAMAAGCSVYAYTTHRLILDFVPFAGVAVVIFLIATLRSLDEQTWRALAYALGMRRRDALIHSIVESSMDCILCVDQGGRIQTANGAATRLFGCTPDALIGNPIARFVPALAASADSSDGTFGGLAGTVTEAEATGIDKTFPVELSVSPVQINEERLFTVILRDITERRIQQRKLEYQATHDSLTALPNRMALRTHLDRTLSRAGPAHPVALLMLDLCRFKEVNDTLGHNIGDRVLCEVARRFQAVVGKQGFLARIGGDEFTVVLAGAGEASAAAALAGQLNESLRIPIDATGVAVDVGLSVGVALYPENATDGETLLKHADIAMYAAKNRGILCEYYDPEYDQHSVRRLTMVGELRSAISTDQIKLFYQPQVNLRTGRIDSMEALVRWHHPTMGAVSPAEFVAIAESTDLIPLLTDWTLREALRQLGMWQKEGHVMRLAVNLSAKILQDVAFPDHLREMLVAAGIGPGSLELEITESAMMIDPVRALRIVKEIHAVGVLIAIDDYGTGYSSLSYLRDLPVHALKLDKSFVVDLKTNEDNRIIVESTVRMAHALRLKVVAEGVETQWIEEFLSAAGYDYLQGYHYSAALPADQVSAWINAFHATRTLPEQTDRVPRLKAVSQ